MDIQQNDNHNQNNGSNQPQSPTKSNHAYIHQSIQSRMSNESMMSIPEQYTTNMNTNANNYPQRISFQSNISQKLRQKQNEKGLFQQLVYNQSDNNIINFCIGRTYGSNPNDYRINRMSQQHNAYRVEQPVLQGHTLSGTENNNNEMGAYEQPLIVAQKIICKCSKSKCLLMYCQCFSKGLVCNQQCSCYQCRNNAQFEQKRQKARQTVLQRDPNAFTNKLQIIGGQQIELAHKRGCNCKKTHCFKKYCQCFHAGVKCTYLCHCQGCLNGGDNAYKQ